MKKDTIRNLAIIAHVDHGKTTLVDAMLQQSGIYGERDEVVDRALDSNDQERERGITILAKNISINVDGVHINVVDTPGHMDFGGEVERTLQMVEGFLLLVDAAEGPLPGTRFVLKKALELGLKPMVLINKIDRKDADPLAIEEQIQDLFLDIVTDDSQLDYPVFFGSSRSGFVSTKHDATSGDLRPLFDAIKDVVPAPTQVDEKLRFLVTNLEHSDFLGRIAVGRVFSGTVNVGDQVICCRDEDVSVAVKVTKIFKFVGLVRTEVQSASFGEIVALAGLEDTVNIGATVCTAGEPVPMEYVAIDEPTLSMHIAVNSSPFAGNEGNELTSRKIRDRLYKEIKTNVALRVEDTESPDTFKVSGRGQLHLTVLVENMRREGFELLLAAPQVIYKTIEKKKYEPFELLTIDVPVEHQGVVMNLFGQRKGLLKDMNPNDDMIRMEFEIPSRGLLGVRGTFLTETRGTGTMNSRFLGYEPYAGDLPTRTRGSLVSMENGKTTGFALENLQARGILFVAPGNDVYEGMVLGEHARDNDLDVNPVKGKKLTNMRASGTDDNIQLAPPRELTLESALDWIGDDEFVEVTPKSLRLRKRFLKPVDRKRNKK